MPAGQHGTSASSVGVTAPESPGAASPRLRGSDVVSRSVRCPSAGSTARLRTPGRRDALHIPGIEMQ